MMSKNTEKIIKRLEKEYKGKVLRKCEWEAILKDALTFKTFKKYVLTQVEPEEKANMKEILYMLNNYGDAGYIDDIDYWFIERGGIIYKVVEKYEWN